MTEGYMNRSPSRAPSATQLDPNSLAVFMETIQKCFAGNSAQLAINISSLFDELRGLSFASPPARHYEYFEKGDITVLSNFVDGLRETIESIEVSGLLGNPWSAASLRRDEVRNASVLRWFLDPTGSHGCGEALLNYILARVGSKLTGQFPTKPSARCSVAVEECPDGDRSSRVDVQIDDPTFFLVVEVKIDAPEQPRQVERYCDIAAARAAGTRPWAVVFLTTSGREPSTAARHIDKVVPISWSEIASTLRRAARVVPPIPRYLAITFAAHITNF